MIYFSFFVAFVLSETTNKNISLILLTYLIQAFLIINSVKSVFVEKKAFQKSSSNEYQCLLWHKKDPTI